MGSSASTPTSSPRNSSGPSTSRQNSTNFGAAAMDQLAISLVMPTYYTILPLTSQEKEAAQIIWNSIINNRSKYFFHLKEQADSTGTNFPYLICADYFSEQFYTRLFQVHPGCKGLFTNSKMKMRLNFMGIITLLLNAMEEDREKFVKTLENLARVHNVIGVKATEYGIGCECLMHSIQKSIGAEEWTPLLSRAFTKFFSRVLDVIVPIVVKYELEHPEKVKQTLTKRHLSEADSVQVTSYHNDELSAKEIVPPVRLPTNTLP